MTSQYTIYYEGKGFNYPNSLDFDYYNETLTQAIIKSYDFLKRNEFIECAKIVESHDRHKHFYKITHIDGVINMKFEKISELER